jgi:hypothetical protein
VILTFFEKVESTKSEMDAKFSSKTCLEKAFFPILSPFMRVKLQNFKKVLYRDNFLEAPPLRHLKILTLKNGIFLRA